MCHFPAAWARNLSGSANSLAGRVPLVVRLTDLPHSLPDELPAQRYDFIGMAEFQQALKAMADLAVIRDMTFATPVVPPGAFQPVAGRGIVEPGQP